MTHRFPLFTISSLPCAPALAIISIPFWVAEFDFGLEMRV
jgi:hypothetical protein